MCTKITQTPHFQLLYDNWGRWLRCPDPVALLHPPKTSIFPVNLFNNHLLHHTAVLIVRSIATHLIAEGILRISHIYCFLLLEHSVNFIVLLQGGRWKCSNSVRGKLIISSAHPLIIYFCVWQWYVSFSRFSMGKDKHAHTGKLYY